MRKENEIASGKKKGGRGGFGSLPAPGYLYGEIVYRLWCTHKISFNGLFKLRGLIQLSKL
jgi:hypothetical protein